MTSGRADGRRAAWRNWTVLLLLFIAVLVALLAVAASVQHLRLQRFLLEEISEAPETRSAGVALLDDNPAFFTRLGRKILSTEEMEMLRQYPEPIRRHHLMRKRALTIEWLASGRRRLRSIMKAHRGRARMDSLLEPRQEFALLANYFLFQSLCALGQLLTLLAGPAALRGIAGLMSGCRQAVSDLLLEAAGIASPAPGRVA